eukprot:CAMPEP_0115451592 /NCGR_PEP_ID=MMETSP0271-20121206/42148_1 /TAXON_ID=71861 /ORGANISM="Scrippsiella trochoidea, Strain CCMP3099" /LENGTH=85 /DNA_ID=CAMNT_0002877873 /DNA_START=90 /DNA_END=343 /DNA_ORIENTATION=-
MKDDHDNSKADGCYSVCVHEEDRELENLTAIRNRHDALLQQAVDEQCTDQARRVKSGPKDLLPDAAAGHRHGRPAGSQDGHIMWP